MAPVTAESVACPRCGAPAPSAVGMVRDTAVPYVICRCWKCGAEVYVAAGVRSGPAAFGGESK